MAVAAEAAIRAWINACTDLVGDGNPLPLGAYTLSQRSPASGAYAVLARNPEGVVDGGVAEDDSVTVARMQAQVFAGTTEAAENGAAALRNEFERLRGKPEPCGTTGITVLVADNHNGPFYVPNTAEEFCFQVDADFTLIG